MSVGMIVVTVGVYGATFALFVAQLMMDRRALRRYDRPPDRS